MIDVCGKSILKCEKRWCDIMIDDGEVENGSVTVKNKIINKN